MIIKPKLGELRLPIRHRQCGGSPDRTLGGQSERAVDCEVLRRGDALPWGRHAWQLPGHMPFQGCIDGGGRRRHGSDDDDVFDDDVFYLFLQKQNLGAKLHIYLEEGTYHKRLFRGPNTNDMKK